MMRPPRGVLRLHDLDGFLRAQEHAGQVGGDHVLPGLERQVLERHRRRADAGIVEQDVEPAEGRLDRGEQRQDRLALRHVGRHRQRLGAERIDFAGDLVEHFLAAAGQHQAVAGFRQGNGHRPADPGAGARSPRRFLQTRSSAVLPLTLFSSARHITKASARHRRDRKRYIRRAGSFGSSSFRALSAPTTGRPLGSMSPICTRTEA